MLSKIEINHKYLLNFQLGNHLQSYVYRVPNEKHYACQYLDDLGRREYLSFLSESLIREFVKEFFHFETKYEISSFGFGSLTNYVDFDFKMTLRLPNSTNYLYAITNEKSKIKDILQKQILDYEKKEWKRINDLEINKKKEYIEKNKT